MSSRTVTETFQHYFDEVLAKRKDERDRCCLRLKDISLTHDRIGPDFAGIAGKHFGCSSEQVDAFAAWPPEQLRLFATALAIAIGCPPQPPVPGSIVDPRVIPKTRFIGEVRPGIDPTIQITMVGRDELEIRFMAERML